MAAWGKLAVNLFSQISEMRSKPRRSLLDLMTRNSGELEALHEDFVQISIRFQLFSFYEARLVNVASTRTELVSKDSAFMGLPHEILTALDANHNDMVKFESAENPDYQRVLAYIKESLRLHIAPPNSYQSLSPVSNLIALLPSYRNSPYDAASGSYQDDDDHPSERWEAPESLPAITLNRPIQTYFENAQAETARRIPPQTARLCFRLPVGTWEC